MKKLVLALTLIIGSMGYVVIQRGLDEQSLTASDSTAPSTITAVQTSSDTTPVQQVFADMKATVQNITADDNAVPVTKKTTTKTTTTPAPTPTPVATTPRSASGYKDGTFTGSVGYQPYGPVQVAVVVSGGRITNVKLLQTPNQGGQTREINSQALPMLVDEVISAQSGNIDGVSGASLTTPAFIESVNSALSKARA